MNIFKTKVRQDNCTSRKMYVNSIYARYDDIFFEGFSTIDVTKLFQCKYVYGDFHYLWKYCNNSVDVASNNIISIQN